MREIGAGSSLYHYQAYGFSIRSDIVSPAPQSEAVGNAPALTIAQAEYIVTKGEAIGPFSQAGNDWIAFVVPGVVQFHVSRGRGIAYTPGPNGDPASIATFLINSALPIAAMLSGKICLRGTPLARGKAALLLLGLPAKGKSSVAAALVQQGHAVLSDGICAFDTEGRMHPRLATITLPSDAAQSITLPPDALRQTRPGLDRYHWPQDAAPDPDPRAVAHIYQLIVHTKRDFDFTDIRGAERINMLRACGFRTAEMSRFGLHGPLLHVASALSQSACFRRAWRPVNHSTPSDLADQIIADAIARESRP